MSIEPDPADDYQDSLAEPFGAAGIADAQLGIAWWNAHAKPERAYWLCAADTAVPAQASAAFQRAGSPVGD